MADDSVWVVIPAYNEEKRIGSVLRKTKRYARRILVVDDGSSDKTAKVAKQAGVLVLRLKKNRGKGGALRAGCDFAVKKGAKLLVNIDADGQHDPALIPKLIETVEKKKVDVVFTYRLPSGQMPKVHVFGNWVLNMWTKVLFGRTMKDTQCGYRAFKRTAYPILRWQANRYAMESELAVKCLMSDLKFAELPIPTVYEPGKKGVTVWDGIKIAVHLLRLRLKG